jgi:hypothetical protein
MEINKKFILPLFCDSEHGIRSQKPMVFIMGLLFLIAVLLEREFSPSST